MFLRKWEVSEDVELVAACWDVFSESRNFGSQTNRSAIIREWTFNISHEACARARLKFQPTGASFDSLLFLVPKYSRTRKCVKLKFSHFSCSLCWLRSMEKKFILARWYRSEISSSSCARCIKEPKMWSEINFIIIIAININAAVAQVASQQSQQINKRWLPAARASILLLLIS